MIGFCTARIYTNMVMIIHDCKCENCPGSYAPKSKSGEIMFGGTLCNCRCHTLKKDDLTKFLKQQLWLLRGELMLTKAELCKYKYEK